MRHSPLAPYAAVAIAVMILWPADASATHFRYGHLSWKARPDLGTSVVEFSLFNSFRRNGYAGSGVDALPVVGDVITEFVGATTLRFGDGTSLGTLDYIVIAYDPDANWIYAKALADRNNIGLPILHTYSSAGPWIAEINTCCRISNSINSPDGAYRVLTTIDLSLETFSPVITLPTIVNCVRGSNCSFAIPAADADADDLTYRLASTAENGSMAQPAGITVNSSTGEVTWSTHGLALGLYSTQVIVEARHRVTHAVKSQVAVDFLINLSPTPAGTAPTFSARPDFTCGMTFDWNAGRRLLFIVSATDADNGSNVTLNVVGLPLGATTVPRLPVSANPVFTQFDWTPTAADGGAHVLVFTAVDNSGLQTQCSVVIDVKIDTDADGLPDEWETSGYTYNGTFVDLPAMGANPQHKDIFVHVDYMSGLRPADAAIALVRASFAAVPNGLFAVPNPDGADGINLHVDVNGEIPRTAQLGVTLNDRYDWSEFDEVKRAHFSEALSLSHHYAVFVHTGPTRNGRPISGIARGIPSSDFIVSLGSWPSGSILGVPFGEGGTVSDQAGTFMHELGHNLSLLHGGFEERNNKPNYLSVMNYSFQFTGLRLNGTNGLFDYSRFTLPQLGENNLNEVIGLNGGAQIAGYGTSWFCGGSQQWTDAANGPVNWNCNKRLVVFDDIEANVAADVNNDRVQSSLASYNDWRNLNFRGGLVGAGIAFPLPAQTDASDIDVDTAALISPPPPSSLSVGLKSCGVRLSWRPTGPLNDYSYTLYRTDADNVEHRIDTTNADHSVDHGPHLARSQTYRVTSINGLGAESPSSIPVFVTGALDRIASIQIDVRSLQLPATTERVFINKLTAAYSAVAGGRIRDGCSSLTRFLREVDAQEGKHLTVRQADKLRESVRLTTPLICCS